MSRTRTLAPLPALLLILALSLLLPAPAALAKPAKETASVDRQAMNTTIDGLLTLLDGTNKRARMDSLDALRKAGFTYEKHLVVPAGLDVACKSADERNVLAGMRAVDWDYAIFYGQPVQQGRVCILPYTQGKRTIASPPLKDKEWQAVQTDPASPAARDILLRRSKDFQRKLLQEARNNPQALDALGARLYGATLQSLYITCILVLAAEESESLDYLKNLHSANFAHQKKVFELLLRNTYFGNQAHHRDRAAIIGQVLAALENTALGKTKRLEAVVEIIQPERDRYLAPCPPKTKVKRK